MKIETSWTSKKTGKKISGYYEETDDFSSLPPKEIGSVCAFCYYNNKFVMVKNEGNWEPISGHVEKNESPEEALIREVKEESNMKVIKYFPLGYLYTYGEGEYFYQTRYFCITEPYGPFVSDPDGGVTEIKLIKPEDISKNINWNGIDNLIKDKCLKIIKNLCLDKKL